MTSTPMVKYALSKRIDAIVDRRINKEFRRRLSKDKWGDVRDHWLQNLLDPKKQEEYYDLDERITLQDLKNEVRSLYFDSLMEFLKSENITLISQRYGTALCNFKNMPAMFDVRPAINRGDYCSFTFLCFVTRKKPTEPVDIWICAQITPWIESKIQDIADFVIRRHKYMPLFEASKTVRRKTVEERTHLDANGRGFIEWDMYSYVQTLGHSMGKELFLAEKYIWSNYELEESDKK